MTIKEHILAELGDNEQIFFEDGFDDAIIGVDYDELIIVYSFTKANDILREKMSEEEAIAYLLDVILLRYVKKKTIWVMDYCVENL